MSDLSALSERWRAEGRRYAAAVNAFVARGEASGWTTREPEPQDPRADLAPAVLDAVREANRRGAVESLRARFPPAHAPFTSLLGTQGQGVPAAALVGGGRVLVRVGTAYEDGAVWLLDGTVAVPVDEVLWFGHAHGHLALAYPDGAVVRAGWEGGETARLAWPFDDGGRFATQLVPFPDGRRVLYVSAEGLFVLAEDGAHRLYPTDDVLAEAAAWYASRGEEAPDYALDMEHGAVSPDGRWIAVGCQDSDHLFFDGATYTLRGAVEPASSYPHHAAFSRDGRLAAVNACHFYNGDTLGVPLEALSATDGTPLAADDARVVALEEGARVYAAVPYRDGFIFGDAYGYLRAVSGAGARRWQHFLGSTIGALAIDDAERTLVATSYAGVVSVLDLDTGEADPYTIGTGTHRERRRWLLWRGEEAPLAW